VTAVNASAGVTTIKGETYFQVVARSTSAGTGLFPIGGNILVAGGERYLIRAKGYQTGYAPAYIQAKTNGTTIDWSYSALPNREGTESWTEQVITIPAGHTVLQVGITWPAPPIGHTYYLNEFEVIKLSAKVPEYQYHLKDHLGNVRMTFTTKDEADSAKATLEASHAVAEGSSFLNYDKARLVYGSLFDSTNGTSPGYAQRLSGAEGEKIGLAKSFSVMPGDTIRAEVFAKYFDVPSDPCVLPTILQTLLANLVNPGGSAGAVVDRAGYGTSSALGLPGLGGYGEQEDEDVPKAFLNYIYINRDFDLGSIRTKYTPITEAALEDGTDGLHELLSIVDTVKEAGYVYVYLSNDGEEVREVYFDDFKVEHVKSPVIQSQNFYPFGLTYSSHSRENSLANQYKFQGQEHQDELDLGWDSFKWRNHMPEIGRFFNIDPLATKYVYNSPYAFSENKVTAHVELEGLESVHFSVQSVRSSDPIYVRNKFSTNNTGPAMTFTVDVGKRTVTNSDCNGADCNKGPNLITNKDGSLTVSGAGNFKNDGMVAFKLDISTTSTSANKADQDLGIGIDSTINVNSSLVTENQAPFQMTMGGTTDGQADPLGSVILNAVPQEIGQGFTSPPANTGNTSNTEVSLYQTANGSSTSVSGVKNSSDKEFKNTFDFNKDKEKINTNKKGN